MLKFKFIFVLLIGLIQLGFAQNNRNYTEIKDLLQDFSTSVNGNYWIRLHQLTKGISQLDIQKYLATWRANRCLLRGVCMANEQDVMYNPDMNAYLLKITLPKGSAFLTFKQDDKGFWRFTKYETEGNVNSCPLGKNATSNFYAEVDLIDTWEFQENQWYVMPESLKQDLRNNGWDEAKIKQKLKERSTNFQDTKIENMRKIQLKADGTCAIEYEGEGEPQKTRWALGYNQFKILSDNGAYVPYTWRIDNEGNLNLIDPKHLPYWLNIRH